MTTFAFGPLAYDVTGAAAPPAWRPFATPRPRPDARVVSVTAGAVESRSAAISVCGDPPVVTGLRFRAVRTPARDEAVVDPRGATGGAPWELGLTAAVAALAALDAPAHGAVLVHAAAVRVGERVALLAAPPGTGKSTLARAAGDRAFAYNAVLVAPGPPPVAWPVPFAGDDDPPLTHVAPRAVTLVALFERAERCSLERLTPAAATKGWLRSVVQVTGGDANAVQRAEIALRIAVAIPVVRLGSPPDPGYLAVVRAFDEGEGTA